MTAPLQDPAILQHQGTAFSQSALKRVFLRFLFAKQQLGDA